MVEDDDPDEDMSQEEESEALEPVRLYQDKRQEEERYANDHDIVFDVRQAEPALQPAHYRDAVGDRLIVRHHGYPAAVLLHQGGERKDYEGYEEENKGPKRGIKDEPGLLRIEKEDDEGGCTVDLDECSQDDPERGEQYFSLLHMGEGEDHEAGQESVALGALHGSEQFNKTEPNYEALLLGRQWELTDGDPEDDPIKDVPKRKADVVWQPG